jgi:hypothetical protein
MTISQNLRAAVKLNSLPAYKIAWQAGVHPNVLSKLLCGIEKVKSNDPRIIAVGRVLGLPADKCFEPEVTNGHA